MKNIEAGFQRRFEKLREFYRDYYHCGQNDDAFLIKVNLTARKYTRKLIRKQERELKKNMKGCKV